MSGVPCTTSEANSLAEIAKTELSQVSTKHQWYLHGFLVRLYTGRLHIKQPAPQSNCQCSPVFEEQAPATRDPTQPESSCGPMTVVRKP